MLAMLILIVCTYSLFLFGFLGLTLRAIGRGPEESAMEEAPPVSGSLKRALMPDVAVTLQSPISNK
jgi:hypothetical protein